MKTFLKKDWIKLLQRDLAPVPSADGASHQYATPENLIVTVTTKNKIRRNYTFGGPVWCAILDFYDDSKLKVSFLSPLKKPHVIKWDKVKEMTFYYISA